MKKLFFSLFLVLALLPVSSHALETNLKGFIALDALNFEKISGQDGAAVIGIGVLDLKIFAEQDNMSVAIKLDLDGKLDKQNNIFEEAYGTYRGKQGWRLSLGKGVVKFQNLHWGAVENTYNDGGSILGTEQNWRKVSRKAFMAVSYGGRSQGFIDQFTFFGNSDEFLYDDNGKLVYVTQSGKNLPGTPPVATKQITGYKTEAVPAFSTNKQMGFANKLELFASESTKIQTGQILYKSEFQDDVSWAVDVGGNYETAAMEGWFDVLYGYTNKLPYESFPTKDKYEWYYQLGAEYYLDETWSVVGNTEGLFIKDLQHTYPTTFVQDGITYTPTSDQEQLSNKTFKSFTYKIEAAIKYKLTKTSFITTGGLFEKKIAEKDGVKDLKTIKGVSNPNDEAYKLSSSISFWF